jgi:hypothetical protein
MKLLLGNFLLPLSGKLCAKKEERKENRRIENEQ